MARTQTMRENRRGTSTNGEERHEHRTAKIVELIGSSSESFEDAIQTVIRDASQTIRGITGCHVDNFSVKCQDGEITEFKVNVKVAFGIERTDKP